MRILLLIDFHSLLCAQRSIFLNYISLHCVWFGRYIRFFIYLIICFLFIVLFIVRLTDPLLIVFCCSNISCFYKLNAITKRWLCFSPRFLIICNYFIKKYAMLLGIYHRKNVYFLRFNSFYDSHSFMYYMSIYVRDKNYNKS